MDIQQLMPSRPKKPALPKKPKQFVKKTVTVWSSNDGTTTLADILHLIPDDVPAENINISITQSTGNSTAIVQASYSNDVINAMYDEQLVAYEQRLKQYEKELVDWTVLDEEWLRQKEHLETHILNFQREIVAALDVLHADYLILNH